MTNSIFSNNTANQGGGLADNYLTQTTVTNCTFSNNSGSEGGGLNNLSGTIVITGTTFSNNTANTAGGGIDNWGTTTVTSSVFTGNTAPSGDGGGIYNYGPLLVTASTFSGNTASLGGAIYDYSQSARVSNSTLSANSASSGGGIYNSGGATIVTSSTLSGNSATDVLGYGYVVGSRNNAALNLAPLAYNDGGSTKTHQPGSDSAAIGTIPNGTVVNNNGVAMVCNNSSTDQNGIARPRITNGGCTSGAVEVVAAVVTCPNPTNIATFADMNACFLWANAYPGAHALALGANITLSAELPYINGLTTLNGNGHTLDGNHSVRALAVRPTANLTLDSITVQNASSRGSGGGLYNAGTLAVTNSTFVGNSASSYGGGGIFNGGTLTVSNSTISGNTSGNGGGINNSGTLNLGSTIVANNTPNPGPDIAGVVGSQGNNLIGNTSGSSGYVGSDQQNVNPLLNSLALSAPGTTQTMSLQATSPAIAKGNCALSPAVTTDQRGIHRKNLCDVGAYETPGTPTETVGLFAPPSAQFYLKNTNAGGAQDFLFTFGSAPSSSIVLVGDWTGQGIKTPGLYDPATGTFSLRNSNSSGGADITFQFGPGGQGFLPVVGDWIGQGHDGVGIYSPISGYFYLKNSLSAGNANFVFAYGPTNASLTPLAGDWTGRGFATVGLFSQANAFFYLHSCNAATCSGSDIIFQYGPATGNGGPAAIALTGRWVGGTVSFNTTIGVYVPANAYFYLKNTNQAGNADNQFQYGPGPNASWKAVMGHWANPGPHISGTPTAQLNGSLGFVSNQDGQWSIYTLSGDETHRQHLISIGNNPVASRPAWSADGKHIAFVSTKSGNPEIYVMNADGSNVRRLTYTHALNFQPAWSPDGKRIVFASNRDNTVNLYVMNADGNNVQQLTHGIGLASEQPAWSPDGQHIVYATGSGTLDLALITADGKTITSLTKNGRQAAWSPDGTRIAFASTRDGNSQVYVMRADGSDVRRLMINTAQDELPTWSPDGKQIAFVSMRGVTAQLYMVNADGSNVQRLTNNTAQDQFPVWLPR